METTEYIWQNGKFIPWADAKVHILTHGLHYGDGAFEGIRAYKTAQGTAVFRLKEHIERLFYSISVFGMELPYTVDELCATTLELLKRNSLEQGYIRPIVFHGYGVMGLNPRGAPVEVAIACWPWGKYLPTEMVDIKVSKYIRIHPQSTVADAKVAGHYVNSILAVLELKGTKYHEALFLDADGYIAEGPGENFFLVNDGKLITPPLGKILNGITRQTVIEYARQEGITVTEREITLDEALNASEAFFTGTAAEVTPIRSINDKTLGDGTLGPISRKIRDAYLDIVYGRDKRYLHLLSFVQ